MSLALYRRYRPESFAEVIGQEHVTAPLQQALRSDRVNHAYLFSGPRGCGKTSSARILARALNCEQGPTPEPCGVCQSCQDLSRTGAGSLDVVEIDAASHGGVDDARDLRERAFYAPASSRFKIYIIDEAHMVTPQGFNALLKVVEEPPPHLKFIFATTEPERVLGTIRSRTHHYPFRLVPPKVLQEYLAHLCDIEGVTVGPGVLPMVVRAGAGSVRDALSVLDQLIGGAGAEGVTHGYAASLLGYTDAALLDSVVDAFAAGDAASVFQLIDRVVESGIDPRRFVADLLERLRDLVILQAVPEAGVTGLLHAPEDQIALMLGQASRFGPAELARAADVVNAGLIEMRGATAPRLQLELICARVLLPAADADAERGTRARLDRLERRFAIGAPAPAPAPAAAPAAVPASVPEPPRIAPAPPATSVVPELAVPEPEPEPEPVAAPTLEGAPEPEPEATAELEPAAESASTDPEPVVVPAAPPEAATDGLDLQAVRRLWPDVLEQVKVRRRVSWMLLFDKVQVLGLDGTTLTLGFPDAGSVKAFAASGHDEVLRLTLIDIVGADWRIDAVHQPGAPATSGTVPSSPSGSAGSTSSDEPAGARGPVPWTPVPTAASDGPVAPASPHPPAGDDTPAADDEDADSDLAGAELIARELGGRVIKEIGQP